MNLEHFCRVLSLNYNKLPNKATTLRFLKYQFELLAWKRQKLKLGAIVFEIKRVAFYNITIREDVEIKFIRQDTTEEDSRKLENVIQSFGWQWNLRSFIALFVVLVGILCQLYTTGYGYYQTYLPTLAFRSDHFDYLIKFGFETSLNSPLTPLFFSENAVTIWVVNVLTDFCIYFNIIF